MIDAVVEEVIALARRQEPGKETCLLLSTTARQGAQAPLRLSGLLHGRHLRVVHVVVHAWEPAVKLVRQADGAVTFIALDGEMKEPFGGQNLLDLHVQIRRSTVLYLKVNDLTADGVVASLLQQWGQGLVSKRIIVIGAGNVGAKIAQRLVELGCRVHCHRRDQAAARTVCDAINLLKPAHCTGEALPVVSVEAGSPWDLVLVCTPGTVGFTTAMRSLVAPDGIVMDVGVGTLDPDVVQAGGEPAVRFVRFDSRAAIVGHLELSIAARAQQSHGGRRTVGETTMVSGGYIGAPGDVIVDDWQRPSVLLGRCDGKGGVVPLTAEERTRYEQILMGHQMATRTEERS